VPTRQKTLLAALVAWTALLWIQRLVNAWGGDETTAAKVTSTVLGGVFLAFAVAGAWILGRHWRRPLDTTASRVLVAFAGWTTVVWTVRATVMVFGDHGVGFKLVHAVLGLISIVLAIAVARPALRRWSRQPVGG
jgi:hypothetical protein